MPNCTCIKLKTVDQRLTIVQQPILASGDVGTVRAEYLPDSFWSGYVLSGTFFTSAEPEDVYEQPLENGACVIPWEVLTAEGILNIGLRGVDAAGHVKTATPVRYRIEKGSPGGTDAASAPTPNVYQQILTTAAKAEAVAQSVRDDADAGQFDGVSVTHEWKGTTLHVTSASGTSSANLKGETGKTGPTGPQGPQGHTPEKGVDYFTEAEVAELQDMVLDYAVAHLNNWLFIAEGSYEGAWDPTVSYSSPSITLTFAPKLLIILGVNDRSAPNLLVSFPSMGEGRLQYHDSSGELGMVSLPVSLTDNTVTIQLGTMWHSALNSPGVTYKYVAIG